jgi:asparagine synthetase B (glutamine-hydrolysing)
MRRGPMSWLTSRRRSRWRAQLDGSVPPACFLSGGTDSSTVAGMIGKASGKPAHTYSIGFEAEGYDEMEYARIAAKHFGTEHHEYYVTPDDLVRSIPPWRRTTTSPSATPRCCRPTTAPRWRARTA